MEKYEIVKKAWAVNFGKIDEGYLYAETWTWAINRNTAKSELLKEVEYSKHNHTGEDITYLTIPIQRAKKYDLVVFEGEETKRCEIPNIIRKRERELEFDKIMKDPAIEYCYILKHGGYYRPNSCGYTDRLDRAGIYAKEDALSSARGCEDISVRAVEVGYHNKMINDEIDELKLRLIKV